MSVVNITMFSLTLCHKFLKIYSSRKQSSLKILNNSIKQNTRFQCTVFRYAEEEKTTSLIQTYCNPNLSVTTTIKVFKN